MYANIHALMVAIRKRNLDKTHEDLCGKATVYMAFPRQAQGTANLDKKLAGVLVSREDLNEQEQAVVNRVLGIKETPVVLDIEDEDEDEGVVRSTRQPTVAPNAP